MRSDLGNNCIGGNGKAAWNLENVDLAPGERLTQRILPLFGRLFWPRSPPDDDLDLVATCPRPQEDWLTRWVTKEWIPFYDDFWNKMRPNRVRPWVRFTPTGGKGVIEKANR